MMKAAFMESHQQRIADDGYCVMENVLSPDETARVRHHLVEAAAESERRGIPTRIETLDPNENNIRVFNLLDLHPVFRELIQHPTALEVVRHVFHEGPVDLHEVYG